jgi:hypothetical protein
LGFIFGDIFLSNSSGHPGSGGEKAWTPDEPRRRTRTWSRSWASPPPTRFPLKKSGVDVTITVFGTYDHFWMKNGSLLDFPILSKNFQF